MDQPATVELQVRIGEIAAAAGDGTCLSTVGLGSCVGVVLIDERAGVVALAHVFLPEPPSTGAKPGAGAGTYATHAIPELIERVRVLGGGPPMRLCAVLVGGATMFGSRSGADIGARNIAAVTSELKSAGVRVAAEAVGGSRGRTVWVDAGAHASVRVREVGSEEQEIWRSGRRAFTSPESSVAA